MSPVMGWLAEGVALLLLLLLLLLLCCIIKVIELQFQFAPFGTLIHSRVSVSQTPTLVHTCYSAIPIPLTHCCHPQNINPQPPHWLRGFRAISFALERQLASRNSWLISVWPRAMVCICVCVGQLVSCVCVGVRLLATWIQNLIRSRPLIGLIEMPVKVNAYELGHVTQAIAHRCGGITFNLLV